jgi:hypothetical protein
MPGVPSEDSMGGCDAGVTPLAPRSFDSRRSGQAILSFSLAVLLPRLKGTLYSLLQYFSTQLPDCTSLLPVKLISELSTII